MNEVQVKGNQDGKLTFALAGDIDSVKSEELYAVVSAEFEKAPAPIVFECENLDFIDSTTLGTFVKILKAVKTNGFSLAFKYLKPKIKKMFVICSVDTIMEIA